MSDLCALKLQHGGVNGFVEECEVRTLASGRRTGKVGSIKCAAGEIKNGEIKGNINYRKEKSIDEGFFATRFVRASDETFGNKKRLRRMRLEPLKTFHINSTPT